MTEEEYACSFCGKEHHEIQELFTGCTQGVFICDECVHTAIEKLTEINEKQAAVSNSDDVDVSQQDVVANTFFERGFGIPYYPRGRELNENNYEILWDIRHDDDSGLTVGDIVRVDVVPNLFGLVVRVDDKREHYDKRYRIALFIRLYGRSTLHIVGQNEEATTKSIDQEFLFAALVNPVKEAAPEDVVMSRYGGVSKVGLFWVGCLSKVMGTVSE